MQVLNFYSTIFADQLKRGRKTATIRLGDKSHKYRKNQAVLVTIGYQYSPREKIFEAVIDAVEVKRVKDLSPRDIEHDNPEFRRHDEMMHFLEQIYGRPVSMDDIVTVVRFSQIVDTPQSSPTPAWASAARRTDSQAAGGAQPGGAAEPVASGTCGALGYSAGGSKAGVWSAGSPAAADRAIRPQASIASAPSAATIRP